MRLPGRGVWLAMGGAVVIGLIAGLLISGSLGSRSLPSVRARVYANYDLCLLAGPDGVSAAPDSLAWAGLEDASAATRARASYLAVTGPATQANALSFLGSLLVRGCGVIVAAGPVERAAVLTDARRFPAVKFVVAGGAPGAPNVTVLRASRAGLRAAVSSAVTGDAHAAGA